MEQLRCEIKWISICINTWTFWTCNANKCHPVYFVMLIYISGNKRSVNMTYCRVHIWIYAYLSWQHVLCYCSGTWKVLKESVLVFWWSTINVSQTKTNNIYIQIYSHEEDKIYVPHGVFASFQCSCFSSARSTTKDTEKITEIIIIIIFLKNKQNRSELIKGNPNSWQSTHL